MESRHTNPDGEIVLESKLNHVEFIFLKNCKNCMQKWILQVIFSRRCSTVELLLVHIVLVYNMQ